MRQRTFVMEPVVEASAAGARTLGVTYWQAVDRFTVAVLRASWPGGGGKLKPVGGAKRSPTFELMELSFDGGLVSCKHAIQGGLLRAVVGRMSPLAQRAEGDQQELSVTVEGYLPAARGPDGRTDVDRYGLRQRAEPVPCRGQLPLLRAPAGRQGRMNVTVFGATGSSAGRSCPRWPSTS